MNTHDANNAAESLLRHILASQPGALPVRATTADAGTEAANFIAALREGLYQMYVKLQ